MNAGSTSMIRAHVRRYAALAAAAAALALLSGCDTTDEDSDLPWNTPQSWEGSPSIPGLTPDM